LASIILLLLPLQSQAWSGVGHRTVAYIAEEHLTERTKAQIRNILPTNETLVSVATWADDIRPLRQQTAPWHYIDLPARENITITNLASYCGTNDLLFHVDSCIDDLKDPGTTPSNRLESLKFVVHFVGDLSVPLHCGDDSDRGGNEKIVRYYGPGGLWPWGETVKLHALWDHLIRVEPHDDPRELAKALQAQIAPAQIEAWMTGGPREWALDTYRVSKSVVYKGMAEGPTPDRTEIKLPRRYFAIMRPVVMIQLEKAGIRLAATLNRMFDPRSVTD